MKKLFLSLTLIASLAFAFTSCDKTDGESHPHSQTFTLGEASYDIDNVTKIQNIQHDGAHDYNAIVISQGKMVGSSGDENNGVVLLFQGDIAAGTYNLSYDPLHPTDNFPKYFFTKLEVKDIVNFSIDDIMEHDEVYVASTGSFTLEINDNVFTITTEGIEVNLIKNPIIIETSSVDYEGEVSSYMFATVVEGNFNDAQIVTAGTTKHKIIVETNIAAFITENGDMIGLTSKSTSFANGLPTGTFTNSTYPIILLEAMNINAMKFASAGKITISKEGENYTVDITELVFNGMTGTSQLHYVGTMPYFDFPF